MKNFFLLLFAGKARAQQKESSGIIYTYVGQMPQFDAQKRGPLNAYIAQHLAQSPNCGTGQVVIKFLIAANGAVQNPLVAKAFTATADSTALQLVRNMPPWKPARQNGKDSAIYYYLPVHFGEKR